MDQISTLYQELHESLGTGDICEEFCTRIMQIIQEAVNNIPTGATVGLRCADRCMSCLIENVDFSKTSVVGIYDLMRGEGKFANYPLFNTDRLTVETCDYVIFATYTHRAAILQELREYGGNIIDIYSLLSEHGIELYGPLNH